MSFRHRTVLRALVPYAGIATYAVLLLLGTGMEAQNTPAKKKGGAQQQPKQEAAADKPATQQPADRTSPGYDPNTLLTSSDAKLVAVFKCAAEQTEQAPADSTCPLDTTVSITRGKTTDKVRAAALLSRYAKQPLENGNGQPTLLASALQQVLGADLDGESVFSSKTRYAVIHLVDRQGAVGQAKQAAGKASPTKKQSTPKGEGTEQPATIAAPAAAPAGAPPQPTTPPATDPNKPTQTPDDTTDTTPHKALDRWILAEHTKSGLKFTEDRRLLGVSSLAVVFIHVNGIVEPGQNPIDVFGDIDYRAIAKEKLPANLQHLLGLLQIAATAQAKAKQQLYAFIGFGRLIRVPVPSDITIFGTDPNANPGSLTIVGQPGKYDDEGKYFWDASVGVPINKLSLLDYEEQNQVFVPKTINKQSVYGLIDLYPIKVDIKSGTQRWLIPRAAAGFGLTGRPGENFFLGGSWGMPQLQFFVGSGFANHKVLLPGADPKNGASYVQRYHSQLTFGLNVPVASALKKLTAKKDTSAGSSTGGAATGSADQSATDTTTPKKGKK